MSKYDLIGKTVYVKSGANEDLKNCGFYIDEMESYEGQRGVVKHFHDFGDTPQTNYVVEFPDGVQWSYHGEFLERVYN